MIRLYHIFTIMIRNSITLASVVALMSVASAAPATFKSATPCWPDTHGDDLNRRVGFRVALDAAPADAVLRIATSGLYRATVDGRFLGYGPARAGHGHFRIDEWPLRDITGNGTHVIGIEVAASLASSYYQIKQPAFLQAEIVSGDKVLAVTRDFTAIDLHPVVVRKLPRYSYQRTFIEAFRPTPGWNAAWRSASQWQDATLKLVETPAVPLTSRGVPYPDFKIVESKCVASGAFKVISPVPKRTYYGFSPKGTGDFHEAEMEARPDLLMSSLQPTSLKEGPAGPVIAPGTFLLHDFGTDLSGFLGFKLHADKPARLLATFDELRTGPHGSVDPHRLNCINAIEIDLPAGTYEFETLEPYTQRYLQLHALDGAITVERCTLRELAHPHADRATFSCSDPRFNAIFKAARQTFRQNATDIFMDCPSRERAGWLCDSFFTARVERALTGASVVERNFLENYVLPEKFPGIKPGMLPMCYPSDPYHGDYIPNWAMWFLLELEEYQTRTADRDLIDRLRPRVEALLEFFKHYENSDGLLEKLDGWIFVEWSQANKFVQDVNYPTNMLYAAAVDAAARIYQRDDWHKKADVLRAVINRQSYDGTYYRDHAKRLPDGKLDVLSDRTEVCQYYAFFFGTATPESRPQLWKSLIEDFGPSRRETKAHPEIHPCNQLPGNMLRMEILSRFGETARIHDEALGYWSRMADTTGTLWEHDKPEASCNHGFASHAAVVLRRDLLGLRKIDPQAKTVDFAIPDNPLQECRGSFPTADGNIVVEWKRDDSKPRLTLPDGWRRSGSPTASTGKKTVREETSEAIVPDQTETPRMKAWRDLHYGLFIHWNINTFVEKESDHPSAKQYAPAKIDVDQWVRVARDAGMKYAVLTAKHNFGFCLWDSKVSWQGKEFDFDVAASGNTTDVLRLFLDACKKYRIVPGLYYNFRDSHANSVDGGKGQMQADYFELVKAQLKELTTLYPECHYFWIDHASSATHDQIAAAYDLLRRADPQNIVLFNAHVARPWGMKMPPGFKPLPAGSGERSDLFERIKGFGFPTDIVNTEGNVRAALNPVAKFQNWQDRKYLVGYEHCARTGNGWGWFNNQGTPFPTQEIFTMYQSVRNNGGNLLLNVGPAQTGRLNESYVKTLMELKTLIEPFEEQLAKGDAGQL